MERTVTAIYDHGLIRPLEPLNLVEHQTIKLKILDDPNQTQIKWDRKEYARALRVLKQQGLIRETAKPQRTRRRVSTKRRRALARALSVGKPLSEISIQDRDEKA